MKLHPISGRYTNRSWVVHGETGHWFIAAHDGLSDGDQVDSMNRCLILIRWSTFTGKSVNQPLLRHFFRFFFKGINDDKIGNMHCLKKELIRSDLSHRETEPRRSRPLLLDELTRANHIQWVDDDSGLANFPPFCLSLRAILLFDLPKLLFPSWLRPVSIFTSVFTTPLNRSYCLECNTTSHWLWGPSFLRCQSTS